MCGELNLIQKQADLLLALIVILFAMIAPIAKIVGLSGNRTLGLITFMGRLAMADVFLVALYVVIAKGTGVGRLETAWGLYLFTACVLVSLALGQVTKRQNVAAI
jgi:paraquat-inducible protein A